MLPEDTYTWVSDASGRTRWLDHVVCPSSFLPHIQHLHVNHDLIGSDHRALCLTVRHIQQPPSVSLSSTNGAKFTVHNKNDYYVKTENTLKNITLPIASLWCRDPLCCNVEHKREICAFYNSITHGLLSSGDTSHRPHNYVEIPGWNELVREHHREARACYIQWRNYGKPRFGPIYWEMTCSRLRFKRALKNCKRDKEEIVDRKIAQNLRGNSKILWKEINKKKNIRVQLSDSIGNVSGGDAICELLRSHYSSIVNDASHPTPSPIQREGHSVAADITVDDVKKAMKILNTDSSPGHDGVTPQHLLCAHPVIHVLLSLLFNCCFHHSFLPEELLRVILSSLVKDKNGVICNTSNYRPIALSTIISKVLEGVILHRCSGFLGTADNQFAYKEKHGTDMAIAVLKNVTLEYAKRNTPIYACFMDMSKAFDKVCHTYLFELLLERGVPVYMVSVLQYWYSSQKINVRWGNKLSGDFNVSCGVRQGSLLSPHLFNLYMNDMTERLCKHKIGCVVNDRIVNHSSYADDIVVFSPSLPGLQSLVGECAGFISSRKLTINANKTKCMRFCNRKYNNMPKNAITINGEPIEFVNEVKYLGYILTPDNNDNHHIASLYRGLCIRANMIPRNFSKCTDDVKCLLFQSFCTSFYCMSLILKARMSDLKRLNVCYNNSLRRVFKVGRYTSISQMCVQNGIPTFVEIRRKSVVCLLKRLKSSNNSIIESLMNINSFYKGYMHSVWKSIAFV